MPGPNIQFADNAFDNIKSTLIMSLDYIWVKSETIRNAYNNSIISYDYIELSYLHIDDPESFSSEPRAVRDAEGNLTGFKLVVYLDPNNSLKNGDNSIRFIEEVIMHEMLHLDPSIPNDNGNPILYGEPNYYKAENAVISLTNIARAETKIPLREEPKYIGQEPDGDLIPSNPNAVPSNSSVPAKFAFQEAPQCFPAHTPITMPDGSTKPISEIVVGESVLSFDEDGNLVVGIVDKVFHNTTREFVRLTWTDNGSDGSPTEPTGEAQSAPAQALSEGFLPEGQNGRERELIATPGHRFLTETGDFMEIGHMVRLAGSTH